MMLEENYTILKNARYSFVYFVIDVFIVAI